MFYVHIDILKNIKYFILKYLIKACYRNFSMYNTLYHTCTYNRLPEDESSGSKNVEAINVVKVHFVGLYCTCIMTLHFSLLRASQ